MRIRRKLKSIGGKKEEKEEEEEEHNEGIRTNVRQSVVRKKKN